MDNHVGSTAPMQPSSCAAAPIHDPTTPALLGVLDITGGANIVVP